MTNFVVFLQFGLPIIGTGAMIAAAVLCAAMRREQNEFAQNLLDASTDEELHERFDDRELRRMFDRRLTILEERLVQILRESQKPAALPVPPLKNELPVEYAVRMARSGASVDDLVRGCGLNIGEAQLILRLHASTRAPAATLTH